MARVVATLAIGLLTTFAYLSVDPAQAADRSVIRLHPGQNVLTWNSAEPYPITAFADTPVTQIHRWDAVRQEWLSHFPGQEGATLPELHLLPRVQYLLFAEAKHELDVPDPIAEIDPHAELRLAEPPNDPLRFEAWWPNKDSPLEDLILLRPDDERLSVKAEVAGGVGAVEVYWVLDGRLNHQGLASDDVELLTGKHDDGRLYAVDGSGQISVTKLPRVVKLPPLELPEMVYGISAHLPRSYEWYTWGMAGEAMDLIRDAGLQLVRFGLNWNSVETAPGELHDGWLDRYQRLFDMLDERGLMAMPIIYNGSPAWANGCIPPNPFVPDWWRECWSAPARDEKLVQSWGRFAASRFPEIRYWQVGNEPNLDFFWSGIDPKLYADHLKAIALGIWYENPDAIIIAAGICCNGLEFFTQLYEFGFGLYHDVNAIHYPYTEQPSQFLGKYLAVMRDYGDAGRPIWSSEMGAPFTDDSRHQALLIEEELAWLTSRAEVRAAFVYNFWDHGQREPPPYSGLVLREYDEGFTPKASYWAVREFLTRQPKPD